jgi:hypothetical protein
MKNNNGSTITVSRKEETLPLDAILTHITALASDRHFFGSITIRFQGPLGAVYIVTERGQRPQELAQEVRNVRG